MNRGVMSNGDDRDIRNGSVIREKYCLQGKKGVSRINGGDSTCEDDDGDNDDEEKSGTRNI